MLNLSTYAFSAYALSGPARNWLYESREARVLAVFERACNLVNEKGQLLSLVTPGLGMGPFAVMVGLGNGRFSDWITVATPVAIRVDEARLQVGQLTVHWDGTPLWQPRPAWEQRRAVSLAEQLPGLCQLLMSAAPVESLAAALKADTFAPRPAAVTHLLATALPAIRLLQHGLTAGERAACETAARGLAGLGGGLTPAGDDFLVGAIYALWACRPAEQASPLAGAMAGEAAGLTTTLSAAWLVAAGRGEAGVAWHNLVDALADGRPRATQLAARAVLATGHTSGADALAGFLIAAACLAGETAVAMHHCSARHLLSDRTLLAEHRGIAKQ